MPVVPWHHQVSQFSSLKACKIGKIWKETDWIQHLLCIFLLIFAQSTLKDNFIDIHIVFLDIYGVCIEGIHTLHLQKTWMWHYQYLIPNEATEFGWHVDFLLIVNFWMCLNFLPRLYISRTFKWFCHKIAVLRFLFCLLLHPKNFAERCPFEQTIFFNYLRL